MSDQANVVTPNLRGVRVAYRRTDEGPFDRVGTIVRVGRKYHTLTNSETGKTEYCFLDSFQELEQSQHDQPVEVDELSARLARNLAWINGAAEPKAEVAPAEVAPAKHTELHKAGLSEQDRKARRNAQARARRAAKKAAK